MEKAIVLLSGSPEGKSRFIEIAKRIAWVRKANAKEFLGQKANGFYWDGTTGEDYYRFQSDLLGLVNKYFNFEEKYLQEKIEEFKSSKSVKRNRENEFQRFLLIIHGVSSKYVGMLESDFGAFKIHISRHDLNSNIELHDVVLYEDDDNFEEEVLRVVTVLTNKEDSSGS